MKKIILATVLYTFLSSISFAQKDSTNRGFISVNGGVALPSGNFGGGANNSGPTNYSGVHATDGGTVNLNFTKPLTRFWSLAARVSFTSNAFVNPGGFPNSINYSSSYDYGSTSYQEYSALFGIMMTIYKIKPVMDFRILIGPMLYSSAEIKYLPYYMVASSYFVQYFPENYYVDIKPEHGAGVAFDLGWSIRFPITKKLFIPVDIDLYYSGYTYNVNYTETSLYPNTPAPDFVLPPKTWFIPVGLINITTGIGYNF